jgi:hypothetical protein
MLMASTRFGVSAGRLTSFRVISGSNHHARTFTPARSDAVPPVTTRHQATLSREPQWRGTRCRHHAGHRSEPPRSNIIGPAPERTTRVLMRSGHVQHREAVSLLAQAICAYKATPPHQRTSCGRICRVPNSKRTRDGLSHSDGLSVPLARKPMLRTGPPRACGYDYPCRQSRKKSRPGGACVDANDVPLF